MMGTVELVLSDGSGVRSASIRFIATDFGG